MFSIQGEPGKLLLVYKNVTGEVLYTLPDITVTVTNTKAPCKTQHPQQVAAASEHRTAGRKQPKMVHKRPRMPITVRKTPITIRQLKKAERKELDALRREEEQAAEAEYARQYRIIEEFLRERKIMIAARQRGELCKFPTAAYWRCLSTNNQQHFYNLYSIYEVAFPTDQVLQGSTTNSGIGVGTALSLHLSHQLSFPFSTWLHRRGFADSVNRIDARQPACFTKIYNYFKTRFPENNTTLAELRQRRATVVMPLRMQQSAILRRKEGEKPKAEEREKKQRSSLNELHLKRKPEHTLDACAHPAKLPKLNTTGEEQSSVEHRAAAGPTAIDICGENLPKCRNTRTYVCHKCCTHTNNPRMYLLHLRDVHGNRSTIYLCPNCQYATKRSNEFIRHMQALHGFAEPVAYHLRSLSTLPYDGDQADDTH